MLASLRYNTRSITITAFLLFIALTLVGCEHTAGSPAVSPSPAVQVAVSSPIASATVVVHASPSTVVIAPSATLIPPSATPAVSSATPVPPSVTPVPPEPSATTLTRPTARPPVISTATTAVDTAPSPQTEHIFPVRANGNVSYGRYHHDYPAADIFCPIGSQFVAVTNGMVDYVSREDTWDPKVNDGATRGGLSVAIVGDDGVRYYGSHLSAIAEGIAPGVRVQTGQLLGRTGKSGDARFVQPHLHFGISHPTTADDWAVRRGEISPYTYLKAWQRGEDVTPKVP